MRPRDGGFVAHGVRAIRDDDAEWATGGISNLESIKGPFFNNDIFIQYENSPI